MCASFIFEYSPTRAHLVQTAANLFSSAKPGAPLCVIYVPGAKAKEDIAVVKSIMGIEVTCLWRVHFAPSPLRCSTQPLFGVVSRVFVICAGFCMQATVLTASIKPGDEVVVNYVDPKGKAEPFSYTIHYWPVEVLPKSSPFCSKMKSKERDANIFLSLLVKLLSFPRLSSRLPMLLCLCGMLTQMVADVLREVGFEGVSVQRLELNPAYVDTKGFDLATFVKHTGNRCLVGRKPV